MFQTSLSREGDGNSKLNDGRRYTVLAFHPMQVWFLLELFWICSVVCSRAKPALP